MTIDQDSIWVIVAIGISNRQGQKAAGPTVVNVVMPEQTTGLRWCGPRGEQRPNEPNETTPTPEVLTNADGRDFESEFLSRELPRVTRRTHRLMHFTFGMPVPAQGEASVPIRVRVESDDLPDEKPEVVSDLMVRARRPLI